MQTRVVVYKDGNAANTLDPSDVIIVVDRSDVEYQQDSSMFNTADTAVRIRVDDPNTRKSVWFAVTPTIKNGKPGLEVEAIGESVERPVTRKRITGKWQSAAFQNRIEGAEEIPRVKMSYKVFDSVSGDIRESNT